jgi:hypothetical protein
MTLSANFETILSYDIETLNHFLGLQVRLRMADNCTRKGMRIPQRHHLPHAQFGRRSGALIQADGHAMARGRLHQPELPFVRIVVEAGIE